jgi:hypothetical protein
VVVGDQLADRLGGFRAVKAHLEQLPDLLRQGEVVDSVRERAVDGLVLSGA